MLSLSVQKASINSGLLIIISKITTAKTVEQVVRALEEASEKIAHKIKSLENEGEH